MRRAAHLQQQYPPGTVCYWWKRPERVNQFPGEVGIINCWGTSLDGHDLGAWVKGVGFVPFECVKVSLSLTKEITRV